MFFSGISDEAGQPIERQIEAHNELGWDHLELRMVDGENITQINPDAFEKTVDALAEADKRVSCFGSAIANWARPITGEFEIDVEDLKQAIPRMHRLKTPFIRVMSYPNHETDPISEPEWRIESIRRMRELATIAEHEGIILAHENCSGWGGLSAENSNILLGEVDSPALKVVFDTGNPVTYGQDAWNYYKSVYNDIAYVHIKDAKKVNGEDEYCMCGDGDGYVKEIVGDLLANGYEGGISIEPHLAAVIHTGATTDNTDHLYQSYVDYGRRIIEIVEEVTN
jgi:sugar phosphate isomerase/epimerase